MILGSGIILGLLFRMGAKAIPGLFIGLFVCHFQFIGFKVLVSFWLSGSMLATGWLALFLGKHYFFACLLDAELLLFSSCRNWAVLLHWMTSEVTYRRLNTLKSCQ